MFLLLLAAYVAVAVCVWIVLNRKFEVVLGGKFCYKLRPVSEKLIVISLAICWPIHLWSWFSEFRKELF